jgi:hypothetical protein
MQKVSKIPLMARGGLLTEISCRMNVRHLMFRLKNESPSDPHAMIILVE